MKLDQESLRPVIIAMSIYLTISTLVPKIAKKPSGIDFIDDIVMMIISQRDVMMSGTILIGLIVFATNYINEEFF
jgi:hypothetical protein